MAIKIGSASKDEKGTYKGGKVGDQTGKEIKISYWYDSNWDVYLECTDKKMADKAVQYMKEICEDDHYGYDQSDRYSGYENIKKNGNKVKGAVGEFDCSGLVLSCYRLAGLNISGNYFTKTMRKPLIDTGKFIEYTEKKYLKDDSYAQKGGIYLKEGSHVIMAIEDGNTKKEEKVQKDIIADKVTEQKKIIKVTLRLGSKGNEVKELQNNLNKVLKLQLISDGIFGRGTQGAVIDFQRKYRLIADGIYGPNTDIKMKALI